MTKRFTSGGVGRFGFDDANRLMDAADKVDGIPAGDRREPFGRRYPFVAKLTADLGTSHFAAGAGGTEYKAFEWTAIKVTKPASGPRSIASGSVGSALWTPPPNGSAVQLAGTSNVGDFVTLIPIPVDGGETWFAIVGAAGLNSTSPLRLDGATELACSLRDLFLL